MIKYLIGSEGTVVHYLLVSSTVSTLEISRNLDHKEFTRGKVSGSHSPEYQVSSNPSDSIR